MKKKVPLTRSQASTKGAVNSPWKRSPSCTTKRAKEIFQQNARPPKNQDTP